MEALLITGAGVIIISQLYFIKLKLKSIVMTQQEAIDKLNLVVTQQENTATEIAKVKTETQGLQADVQALKDAAGNQPDLSPEFSAAIDKVLARSQAVADGVKAVDDLVADAPTIPPADAPGTFTDSEGDKIVVSLTGDLPQPGDQVTIGGVNAIATTFILTNGATLVTDSDGKVISYTPAS